MHYCPHAALVAQLDRASDFESEGREFESLRARQSALLGMVIGNPVFHTWLQRPVVSRLEDGQGRAGVPDGLEAFTLRLSDGLASASRPPCFPDAPSA